MKRLSKRKEATKRRKRQPAKTLRSLVRPWINLLSRVYDELQASRMLQRDPAEVLCRATEHLDQRRPPQGEGLKLHLITVMLMFTLALDDETAPLKTQCARRLKMAALAAINSVPEGSR
ncbi:MAG: hypothetical protein ACJ71W_05885 [Terriglobales bacterium]